MEKMSPAEIRAFLMDSVRTGKFASVRADGRPHVTPIWYTMDGDDLIFMTWHTSVKAKNIARDGRVSICVDEETPPFSYVIVEGTASFDEVTPEERVHWATVIGGRYMGADRADEYGQRNGVEGEHIVRLRPTRILAHKNVAD